VYSIVPTKFEMKHSSIMDLTPCGASHVSQSVEASPDPVSHTPLVYSLLGSTHHTPRAPVEFAGTPAPTQVRVCGWQVVILACQRFIIIYYDPMGEHKARGRRVFRV
jgi:hypothetical protein